jgi:hypothetical protein
MQSAQIIEGPLGFPVTDRQAIALDAILKQLLKGDEFRYRKSNCRVVTCSLAQYCR